MNNILYKTELVEKSSNSKKVLRLLNLEAMIKHEVYFIYFDFFNDILL